ncbi:MAG: CDP-diacylglycerol--serine O-phosphatidyltransferase [Desulfovibrionaceae bacterium]|jgi:CDP-diacylglycerol--serine O-phosphatidyltransferase|nr:CDP-diacylglycerol--serine O-phosphatidyltransferase [Desulfovibrionaceae bacterium]
MDKPVNFRKGVYILPNLLTTASLFSGFLGLVWAVDGDFERSALAILVSALLDGLDGKVARLTKTASEFGVQLDSLADLAAFGVTPAFMLYLWQLKHYGTLGLMACFLFVACGALRLARFNVQSATSSKKFFTGLPIPAAGCTIATLVFFSGYVPPAYADTLLPKASLVLAYLLSFLMVSRVRYASFKEYGMIKAHPFGAMVSALLVFVLVASQPKLLGFILIMGYIISGIAYTYLILPRRHPKLLREAR